jgi:hypothetical protein
MNEQSSNKECVNLENDSSDASSGDLDTVFYI